ARSSTPASSPTCPACGKAIDPLRAGQVAIQNGVFVYYCDLACKRDAFEGRSSRIRETMTADPPPVTMGAPVSGERASGPKLEEALPSSTKPTEDLPPGPTTLRSIQVAASSAPEIAHATSPDSEEEPQKSKAPQSARSAKERRRKQLDALTAVGAGFGLLAAALVLGGPALEVARAPLACVATLALALRVFFGSHDPSAPHPLAILGPPIGALLIAVWAHAHGDAHASSLISLAGLAAAGSLLVAAVVERAFDPIEEERERVAQGLAQTVRVIQKPAKDEIALRAATEVRSGEHVVVEAGDVVGVDALVVAGEASVLPWLGAHIEATKKEGDAIVAGAKLVSGRLRLVTTWSGNDRAWVRLSATQSRRLEVASPMARLSRTIVERGAPLAAFAVAGVVYANGASAIEVLGAAWAAAIAVGAWGVSRVVALHHARAHASALEHGIVFKDPFALADAGMTNTAVICARGTVLMGEPEIVALEATGSIDADRMLSLAAGAEAASAHPFASAILRAARARAIRAEAVRNASVHEGLGVTALSATGERLVVGGRALLLRERVSVAAADARISGLEAEGRSVLLVALGSKLVGIVALQDGLRAGARGAIQRLHDARIEPVLMTGEARETCETIARALDIDHVRPEVPPHERGAQVKALREGGHVVATIGHPDADDGALGAADVAVAMGAAGATPGEWSIALASHDVRDAAFALKLARGLRDRVRTALVIGFAPSALMALGLAFGALPLAL
ncbi:MAG: HAD-IC family P-type ATPase, partial [Polyangiaceae bacterium]